MRYDYDKILELFFKHLAKNKTKSVCLDAVMLTLSYNFDYGVYGKNIATIQALRQFIASENKNKIIKIGKITVKIPPPLWGVDLSFCYDYLKPNRRFFLNVLIKRQSRYLIWKTNV
jgi:hypothetical protein